MGTNWLAAEIAASIARETAKSRHRDRCSRERIHPGNADVRTLVDMVTSRSGPELAALARRVLQPGVDIIALRALALHGLENRGDRRVRAACRRVLAYCTIIEAALAVGELFRKETS